MFVIASDAPELRAENLEVSRQFARSKAMKRLIMEMAKVMFDRGGIGIAAPQVGHNLKVIVLRGPANTFSSLINPELVLWDAESIEGTEGCLSLPGKQYNVVRYKSVQVKARATDGKTYTFDAAGLQARVLQHELDHLEGKLIADCGTLVEEERSEPASDHKGTRLAVGAVQASDPG